MNERFSSFQFFLHAKLNFKSTKFNELFTFECRLKFVYFESAHQNAEKIAAMKLILLILSILITHSIAEESEINKNTLVLLDSLATRETHSIFFKTLTGEFWPHHRFVLSLKIYLKFCIISLRSRLQAHIQACRRCQPFTIKIRRISLPKSHHLRTSSRRVRRPTLNIGHRRVHRRWR